MNHRTLHQFTCPCGQIFVSSIPRKSRPPKYCSKKCSAYYRVKRDGMPMNVKPSIDALKEFRR